LHSYLLVLIKRLLCLNLRLYLSRKEFPKTNRVRTFVVLIFKPINQLRTIFPKLSKNLEMCYIPPENLCVFCKKICTKVAVPTFQPNGRRSPVTTNRTLCGNLYHQKVFSVGNSDGCGRYLRYIKGQAAIVVTIAVTLHLCFSNTSVVN
jgi:hypothetical protein